MTQNNVGIALMRLGARESTPETLEAALAAYRAALKEYTLALSYIQFALVGREVTFGQRVGEPGLRIDAVERGGFVGICCDCSLAIMARGLEPTPDTSRAPAQS